MLLPVVTEVLERIGCTKSDMGFVCSGSADYLVGGPFSFVGALDAVGAWPPMRESHVEMDGAFALYEAWTMLQSGDCDTALVYSFGRSSPCQLDRVLALQLDPYYMAPLWPDPIRSCGVAGARSFRRRQGDGLGSCCCGGPKSTSGGEEQPEGPVDRDEPWTRSGDARRAASWWRRLRRYAVPPITDGAAAVVIAAGDRARELSARARRGSPDSTTASRPTRSVRGT